MDPFLLLPQKRQSTLTRIDRPSLNFHPRSIPTLDFYQSSLTPPKTLGDSKNNLITLSFESIKVPNAKNPANFELTPSSEDYNRLSREFAGQDESKNYSLREIYQFRKSNPQSKKRKEGFKTMEKISEHYSIKSEKVSAVTDSFFCYSRKNYPDRAIPYKDELEKILKMIHFKRGMHLTLAKSVDRACELLVYWPGYLKDIKGYLQSCSCKQVTNLWCK